VVGLAAALTVSEKALDATSPLLSVTLMVNVEPPVVVGVPLIFPLEAPRDRPAGKLPPITEKLYGEVPPVVRRSTE